jgi:hypothetical protein
VLWGDTADVDGPEVDMGAHFASPVLTISHSDLQGGLAAIFLAPGVTLKDGGGNKNADPLFKNAATGDLHLLAGSPCIDAGDSSAPGLVGITTDLDGNPRFVGASVDMGAFEFQGDTIPPVIHDLFATPNRIYPPNNQLVNVYVYYRVSDNSGQEPAHWLTVTSNDPGSDANNIVILDAHHLKLRATGPEQGRERAYTITVTCQDASGNTTTAQTIVYVEANQRR